MSKKVDQDKFKYEDDDEIVVFKKNTVNKYREKKINRALKTKDINVLLELEDDEY